MKQLMEGKHQPIYIEETKETNYPILKEDIETDIAIIGGGIVGITLAYLLKDAQQKVTLLEADRIAMGMSVRTTAKLTLGHNLIYDELMHTKSPGKAKQYANINQSALDFVRQVVKKEKIDCDLKKSPAYVYTEREKDIRKIKDEVESCRRLGIRVEYKETLPLNLPIKAAIEWEDSYVFHVRKYLLRLAELFVEAGGNIYERTPIQSIETDGVTVLEATTKAHIRAKKVIIASHFPMYDGLGFYFSRLQMKRNYVIAVEVDQDKIPEGNYISADEPRFSIRPIADEGLVLIAGGEHRTGDDMHEESHFEELKAFAKDVFGGDKVSYYWSTQDYVTSDKVPYIGYLNSKRSYDIYVATGFNKWGMTGGTSAALVLKEMLLIGRSEYEELFNPMRGQAFSGGTFLQHNAEGIKNYIQGKLHQVPKGVLPEKGEAITTKMDDGNVYGIYHDEDGYLHMVNVICSHMGATLRWNSAEKSWDCPFHGSRFSIDGDVLEGPSTHGLKRYGEGKNQVYPNLY